jgi:hypothetical protein
MTFAEKVRAHEQKGAQVVAEQRLILQELDSLSFDAKKRVENAGWEVRGLPDLTAIGAQARKLADRIDQHEKLVREFYAEEGAEVT